MGSRAAPQLVDRPRGGSAVREAACAAALEAALDYEDTLLEKGLPMLDQDKLFELDEAFAALRAAEERIMALCGAIAERGPTAALTAAAELATRPLVPLAAAAGAAGASMAGAPAGRGRRPPKLSLRKRPGGQKTPIEELNPNKVLYRVRQRCICAQCMQEIKGTKIHHGHQYPYRHQNAVGEVCSGCDQPVRTLLEG